MQMAFGAMCLQHQHHIPSQLSEICAQLECSLNALLSLYHLLSTMDEIEIFW